MFSLDMKGGMPIYEQLYEKIVELISSDVIKEDEKLPTVREVAKELGINPNTVQKTYQRLEQDSLIYTIPAKGSYVAKRETTNSSIQRKALALFEEAVQSAIRYGVGKEVLHKEIDRIAG